MNLLENIPQWKLERFLLGELSAAEMKSIEAARNENPEIASKLTELEKSNIDFFANVDPHATARRLQALAGARSADHARSWIHKPVTAFGAFALLAIVTLFSVYSRHQTPAPIQLAMASNIDSNNGSNERIKGMHNRIEVWEKAADTVAILLEGAKVKKGTLLQIRTQVSSKCFAAVVSLDGRGNWTTHLPETGTASVVLEPGKSGFLPFSYQIDDAPRYEVFWLITSNTSFRVDSLLDELAPLKSSPIAPPILPLGLTFTQSRLMLAK